MVQNAKQFQIIFGGQFDKGYRAVTLIDNKNGKKYHFKRGLIVQAPKNVVSDNKTPQTPINAGSYGLIEKIIASTQNETVKIEMLFTDKGICHFDILDFIPNL